MENAKFTPGRPWGIAGRYVTALKHKIVAEIPEAGIRHGKVDAANARLIAAAPEMYEALMLLLANDLPVEDEEWEAQAKGRELGLAALAKAGQP